jgi:P27 family predicted phage terminase small subunit
VRGRKPKPAYLRVLDGNAGHRVGNPDAPQPVGDLVDAPPTLSPTQQAVWRRAIEHAPPGMLKHLDRSVFEAWVIAVDTLEKVREKVSFLGPLIKGPGGGAIVNPLMREQRGQANLVRQLAAELGFSPTSRQRVKVPKSNANPQNPFDGLKSLDD